VLQSKVDVAAAQLQADNASINALLDQIQNLAATAAGLAPELTPFAQPIADTVGEIDMTYQANSDIGAAAEAWALGQGAQQINDLMAQSASASNGLASAIAANMQALLTVLQSLGQSAATDAQGLADAQAALDACNAAVAN
jgi:ABC-type transporter Mla subunit MlaD